MKKNNGQVNFIDFAVGFSVFIIAFLLLVNYTQHTNNTFSSSNAVAFSNAILGEGIPLNWNTSYYLRPGITNSNRSISPKKWKMLYNLSKNNPEALKESFGIGDNFMMRLNIKNGSRTITLSAEGISLISTNYAYNFTNISDNSQGKIKKIERVQRIAAYNGTPVGLEVLLWQ